MKKLLIRLVLGVIVLLVVVGVIAYLWIDSIAKAGIEEGGTYALGVKTKVDTVSLKPFRGTMELGGLDVANPEGFKAPHLMHTGKFNIEMVPGSLLDDTIVLKRFDLDGLNVNVEQTLSKSNISVILDNLKRLGGGEAEKPEPEKAEEGKKVRIDRITIRNVSATFHLPALSPLEVKVPEIELTKVTGDNADGVVVSELVARLVPAILAAVLQKAQGVVPPDILNGLNGDLSAAAKALGGQAEKLVQDVHGTIGNVLGKGAAGDLLKGAGKALGVDANGAGGQVNKAVGGAIEGLLGGKKPDAKDANTATPKKTDPTGGLLNGLLPGKK